MMFTFLGRAVADRLSPLAQGPRTAADIDPDALATALGLSPGAVTGVEVIDVDHGTSQRSRLLVRHTDGTTTALFAKNTPLKIGPRILDGLSKLCEREAKFYTKIAPGVTVAPRALVSEWEPRTGRSAIVLTDLADVGFRFRPATEPCTVEQAKLVLNALASLHAPCEATSSIVAHDPIYDLNGPTSRWLSRFVCRVLGRRPKSLVGLVPDEILEESRVLATYARQYPDVLAGFPQTFIHNDTHGGNIGFTDDRAVLIDWQLCGWGPAMKDVAYFMATALDPTDRRAHERDLLGHYLKRIEQTGAPTMHSDDAWFAYRILVITGYVAAAVTAMFRGRLQAAANAEESTRRAYSAVRDLDSFTALREQITGPRSFT